MSLKVTSLSKRYGQKWILRDVSLEVERGEIFGLFGAAATGKTTLLKIISGIEKGNGGSVTFDSKELSSSARRFYYPTLSSESIWRKIFRNTTSSKLSGAERQILSLNDAFTTAESILLLDNSFCLMDAVQKREHFAKLRSLVKEKQLAVIFATNNYEDVFFLCDNVAVIANGEIKQFGTPQTVYDKPECETVARITGRNNLFEARRLKSSKAELPQFQTIVGEHRLIAQKIERRSLGALNQNVTLGIRPEHISISFGASFPEDNLLKATITAVQFLGATTLVELDSNGLKLYSLVLRLVGLNTGDECMVGMPPDRIHIFKD